MKDLDRIILLKIFLLIIMSFFYVGCDGNSSGSKETQQLDNDNDPTAIEAEEAPDSLLVERTIQMDDKGEFILIKEFNMENAQKFQEQFNLETSNTSISTQTNTQMIGADKWKPWGGYQYRVQYLIEGGTLKAKPLLRNNKNEEIEFSSHSIDSLNLRSLWIDIQRNSFTISNNYK